MDHTESLTTALNVISLEDEEEGGMEVGAEEIISYGIQGEGFNAKLCIVGRFIQEGRIDSEAMKQTLVVLWKPGKEFT